MFFTPFLNFIYVNCLSTNFSVDYPHQQILNSYEKGGILILAVLLKKIETAFVSQVIKKN